MCEVRKMKEFIIKYTKESLEKVLKDLAKLNFFENAEERIEINDRYITKIEYRGKGEAEKILEENKIKYEPIDDVYIL